MEKRRLGRTGHMSTVAIFGAAAFWSVTQAEADQAMEEVIAAGVNHVDVAPSYGVAEERLGPWMARERDRFFLGCKTMMRTKEEAAAELRRSLERLRVDHFDLYQLHEIVDQEKLDQVTAPGGALEAIVDARSEGLTRYIGITGHGMEAPRLYLEALRRFDFDTVIFPINYMLYAEPTYRRYAEELVHQCRARDIGTMIIKSVAKAAWDGRTKTYGTWYEPFDDAEHIQQAVNFALSQDVTGVCTAGDPRILRLMLTACERFTPLTRVQQEQLVATTQQYEPFHFTM
jgi:aryl-alcohol dehydrogenase-like predicted oxidoreductase